MNSGIKKGLEAVMIDSYQSRAEKALQRKYGITGVYIYLQLIRQMGQGEGYYMLMNEEAVEDLSDELAVAEEAIVSTVDFLVKRSVFDKVIFDKYNVITNEEIQIRWAMVARRRAGFKAMLLKYWIAPEPTTPAQKKSDDKPKSKGAPYPGRSLLDMRFGDDEKPIAVNK